MGMIDDRHGVVIFDGEHRGLCTVGMARGPHKEFRACSVLPRIF